MKKVNALTLRQSFGRVLRELEKTGEPILLEKGREPKAVLISIKDFNERFVDRKALEERKKLIESFLAFQKEKPKIGKSTTELLRELRGPLP